MNRKYGYAPYSFCKTLKSLGVEQNITPEFYVKTLYGQVYITNKDEWNDILSQKICDAYRVYDLQDIYGLNFTKTLQEKIKTSVKEFSSQLKTFHENKRMATGPAQTNS